MPTVDRRRFLQLTGGAAALTMLDESVARAASIPANRATGSLKDIEHVVVLMQENRAFDHYFGTMRGVRGFGDPHPATLPSGKSVWHQSDGTTETLPFRPDVDDMGLAFLQDLDHSWDGGHGAFNAGRYDRWIPTKSPTTMAHMERRDMPFQYALAEAFTVCDAYHCSLIGPTDPNRYYMWTGGVGNDGTGGGPVVTNAEVGYGWTTYPERLETAGVSWKVYQDVGEGLDAAHSWGWGPDAYIGNYGDNSLLYFDQYRTAQPGSPLYDKARTGTNNAAGEGYVDQLKADVLSGSLPQVSWIVGPEAFTEHPNWPVNYGAWYVSQVLDALTADPEVWSRTALLLTFDENDGFFDHVVPAHPNSSVVPGASTVSTKNELYQGPDGQVGPYGLGQRVPMMVISPWSTGGWVCSETFDHTSILRFLEKRFGVREPQISPWRRAVCGDLTSAFDFGRQQPTVPTLPGTAAYVPPDRVRHPDYVPTPPTTGAVPQQEKGTRPSRALPYRLAATTTVGAGSLKLTLTNTGRVGAHVQARSTRDIGGPLSYTVGAGDTLTATVPLGKTYDVELHGPAGFYRRVAGLSAASPVEVTLEDDTTGDAAVVHLTSLSAARQVVVIVDTNTGRSQRHTVLPRQSVAVSVSTSRTGGWYDLTVTTDTDSRFRRVLAGRVETGQPRTSDPLIGR